MYGRLTPVRYDYSTGVADVPKKRKIHCTTLRNYPLFGRLLLYTIRYSYSLHPIKEIHLLYKSIYVEAHLSTERPAGLPHLSNPSQHVGQWITSDGDVPVREVHCLVAGTEDRETLEA